jgi:YVTN family beta-propeller protein
MLYVVNKGSGVVSVIATAIQEIMGTIQVGKAPQRVVVTPDRSKILITNAGDDTVSLIETATHQTIAVVPVGNHPLGMGPPPRQYPSVCGQLRKWNRLRVGTADESRIRDDDSSRRWSHERSVCVWRSQGIRHQFPQPNHLHHQPDDPARDARNPITKGGWKSTRSSSNPGWNSS